MECVPPGCLDAPKCFHTTNKTKYSSVWGRTKLRHWYQTAVHWSKQIFFFFLQIILPLYGCFYALLMGFLPICQLLKLFVLCNMIKGQISEGDLTDLTTEKKKKENHKAQQSGPKGQAAEDGWMDGTFRGIGPLRSATQTNVSSATSTEVKKQHKMVLTSSRRVFTGGSGRLWPQM